MLDAPCPRLTLWDVDEPCVGARAHHRLMLQSGRCSSVGRGGMARAATHGLEPNRCVAARPRAYGRRSRTSQVRRVETRERRAESRERRAARRQMFPDPSLEGGGGWPAVALPAQRCVLLTTQRASKPRVGAALRRTTVS
eukprot:scaffold61438_cov63-Phaeocystis_antarctica.AAC.2